MKLLQFKETTKIGFKYELNERTGDYGMISVTGGSGKNHSVGLILRIFESNASIVDIFIDDKLGKIAVIEFITLRDTQLANVKIPVIDGPLRGMPVFDVSTWERRSGSIWDWKEQKCNIELSIDEENKALQAVFGEVSQSLLCTSNFGIYLSEDDEFTGFYIVSDDVVKLNDRMKRP